MATDQVMHRLHATLDKLQKVDLAKVIRKNLGEESLGDGFAPQQTEIQRLQDFVRRYAQHVHDSSVNQARETFEAIANLMIQLASIDNAAYIGQRSGFIQQVENHLRESRQWRPPFITAAIEERGFLEDEGIRQEYRRAVEQLQKDSAATLENVKQEADRALEGAKKLAEEIESRARKTATKISLNEAQQQFSGASTDLSKKVKTWGWRALGSTLVLVVVAAAFMFWSLPGPDKWAVSLYHTVLRVFVLGAAGALSAFSFRMLRAHMHMAEKNQHRVRVANSVESFVNSALEPQQRDLLLAKLAEAIIDFGESGIIKRERDDQDASIVSADTLGRILAAVTRRP